MVYDDGAMYEAYFRVEVLVQIRNGVLRLCTHRMTAEAAESNKNLRLHDVIWVGDVGARCCKGAVIASSQGAAGLEGHEAVVPVNHSDREQAEEVHGCCRMGLEALRRNRKDKEQIRDENLSKHLHVYASGSN